jgi:hypothetical protein
MKEAQHWRRAEGKRMRRTDAFAQVFGEAQELGEGVVDRHEHLSRRSCVTVGPFTLMHRL